MANPFQAFIDLITFDRSLVALEKQIGALSKEIKGIDLQLADIEAKIEASKLNYHNARKHVDQQELIMKEFNEKETLTKKRLDTASNQKEYKALQFELETVQKKQQDQEVVLLSAWNEVEQAEKKADKSNEELITQRTEIQEEKSIKEAEIKKIDKQLHTKEKERDAKTVGVNEEWLEKYRAMRSQVDNPVVQVVSGACSACFLSIPSQMIADLRHKKMLQCKGCYRFLYLQEAQQPEVKEG